MNIDKLIINVALTGIIPTKDENPYLPVTPREIAVETKRVYDLGASIVHIHARDRNGSPSYKKEIYREIIGRIRDLCDDIIITVSTSGRRTKDLEKRMEVLDLDGDYKPDMASLTLGSLNFLKDYSLNPPETIITLITRMNSAGIKPELEVFDTGMVNYMKYLYRKGLLTGTNYCNLIFGSLGTMPATPRSLVHVLEDLPESVVWAATGVGRFAFRIQSLSVVIGGHVRVGLEDSLYMDENKTELATNEKLVLRIKRLAEALGREIATPGEARRILNL